MKAQIIHLNLTNILDSQSSNNYQAELFQIDRHKFMNRLRKLTTLSLADCGVRIFDVLSAKISLCSFSQGDYRVN